MQIGDVTGEVIDLGLVRLYLMELGGHGSLGPTGRVVAFANSIVFQVSSGLFKQIHGVDFVWHDITLTLPPGADMASAKKKLLEAATDALKDYRDDILRQSQEIQRTAASDLGGGRPATGAAEILRHRRGGARPLPRASAPRRRNRRTRFAGTVERDNRFGASGAKHP